MKNKIIKKIKSLFYFLKTSFIIFKKTKSFREIINGQFSSDDRIVLKINSFDYIVDKNGNKYCMSKLINVINQVEEDYLFNDIKNDDIVIDIGASIGGFSIPASKKAKKVYAVEPITPELLEKNVNLNQIKNIDILNVALGDGKEKNIKWLDKTKKIKTKTLTEIKEICGGCDFLKIDCEGSEWDIKPEELRGIRRIEMEVHKLGFPISLMKKRLEQAGFDYKIKNQTDGNIGLWIIHANKIKK